MNEKIFEQRVTRKQFVAAGLAAGAFVVVGRMPAQAAPGGWSFVDDRGVEARRKTRPARIVAYSSAAAALYHWGVVPVGIFGSSPRSDSVLADFPWSRTTVVGSVYGEIDVEKLLSLEPDLIVSKWYPPPRNTPLFGFKDLTQQQTIGSQVPIVGLNGHTTAINQITRFADLARALGVDTGSGRLARAHAAFVEARARLAAVAKTKSNLRIIAVSGSQNTMYVAKLVDSGDLDFFRRLGVPLVSAETSSSYWDRLSWEQAGKYPADGIIYDARPITMTLSEAKKIPTFAALPAVKANQVGAWEVDPAPAYQDYTKAMNDLATTIAGWRKVT